MYKYDMHVHTNETSHCGRVNGIEVARLYKENGYSGIVVTDHYHLLFLSQHKFKCWEKKIDSFLKGYRQVLAEGEKIGLQVLLGMELRFRFLLNDYLVYGIDEKFLYENTKLCSMSLKKFKELAEKNNLLIYQAHPYRYGMTRADSKYIDGVEVYNGNPRHDSKNDKALKYAEEKGLLKISGSDFHQCEDIARGGVILKEKPIDGKHLVSLLQKDIELIQ